jgi:hypothetical protein
MRSFVAVLALLATPALAQDAAPAAPAAPPPPAPTAEEIQKVTAYYLKGKEGGPILIDFALCAELGKNEDGKTTCAVPLAATIKKGDGITAFVKFFAPRGGKYEDLQVKFLLNGEVRSTSDMSVTESWTGYSNYKKTTASKPGTWEVQVLRGDKVLGSKTVKVE